MPHIAIMAYPGRRDELKKEVSKKLQKALMEAMDMKAGDISVSFTECQPGEFEKDVNEKFSHDDIYITSDYIK